jgi:putative cell wall-binding protein/predicted secreted protein
MNKKRNLAVVMAAATVATSVAPVFAAEAKDLTQDELVKEVGNLLNTKYTLSSETNGDGKVETGHEYRRSVYKIIDLSIADETSEAARIKDVNDLTNRIEKANINNNDFSVKIVDKGHIKDTNGNIVTQAYTKDEFITKDIFETKYIAEEFIKQDEDSGTTDPEITDPEITDPESTEVVNKNAAQGLPLGVTQVTKLNLDGDEAKDSEEVVTVEMDLKSSKTISFEVGDVDVDFSKPVDSKGNEIKGTDSESVKRITGFKKIETDNKEYKIIPSSVVAKYTVANQTVINEKVEKYYTAENGYTDEGEDLVNKLGKCVKATEHKTSLVYKGIRYEVVYDANDAENNEIKSVKGGNYELTIKLTAKKDKEVAKDVKIVLTSDDQKDLSNLSDDLKKGDTVVAGKVTTLAGTDRFETAVEISKEAYDDFEKGGNQADAVVLVGENSIVDGLASAPLAAVKNAPVLLTKAKEVPQLTLKEIERVRDEDCDIYLIGGTNTISKDVEKQLIKEFNANIIRVAGADRYETSSEIADEIADVKGDSYDPEEAFIVGGDGLADAMSIASIAAKREVPILVNPKDNLDNNIKNKLRDMNLTDITIVGGTTKISTQVLKDIKDDNKINPNGTKVTVDRLSGETRADTNAKVLKAYFTKDSKGKVIVAKDGYVGGDGQLIDALAVAPFAAKDNIPVVLASDNLSDDQDSIVQDILNKENDAKKIYQVGQGVGSKVIKALLDYLDL